MNELALPLALLLLLPAALLVAWADLAMTRADEDLRSFVGLVLMHRDAWSAIAARPRAIPSTHLPLKGTP